MHTSGAGITAKRFGLTLGDDFATTMRADFHERLQSAAARIMKAEQWIVLYEILALMPATGLITLGRMGL